jgi:hypothetical protein
MHNRFDGQGTFVELTVVARTAKQAQFIAARQGRGSDYRYTGLIKIANLAPLV